MKRLTLTTALTIALALGSDLANASPVVTTSFGTFKFELETGTAILTIGTSDTVPSTPDQYTITSLTGQFFDTGSTVGEAVSLIGLPPPSNGTPFGTPPFGNTASDNKWFFADVMTNPHLDTGGFAFSYGTGTPSDQYQVFAVTTATAKGYEYRGCWGVGSCIVIPDPVLVPEPTTLALMSLGLAGMFFGKRRKLINLNWGSRRY